MGGLTAGAQLTSLVSLGKQILWQMRETFCSMASTSTWCGGCFRDPVLEQVEATHGTCHPTPPRPSPSHQPPRSTPYPTQHKKQPSNLRGRWSSGLPGPGTQGSRGQPGLTSWAPTF